jgi:hypothetical protein
MQQKPSHDGATTKPEKRFDGLIFGQPALQKGPG